MAKDGSEDRMEGAGVGRPVIQRGPSGRPLEKRCSYFKGEASSSGETEAQSQGCQSNSFPESKLPFPEGAPCS